MKKLTFRLTLWCVVLFLYSCQGTSNQQEETQTSQNDGNLDNTFVVEQPELTPKQKLQQERSRLIAEGWQDSYVPNGQLPNCYNFKPKKANIDNYLEVYVGSGTDVAIKVMNASNENCIRYVFINSGSTYRIANIPEGRYYLKIAYGKNWLSKVSGNQCVGKFIQNPMYEKGTEILDFNFRYSNNGYSVPSFQLQLDVIQNDISNTFNSENISEGEFNQ